MESTWDYKVSRDDASVQLTKQNRDQLIVFPETALILPEKENKDFIDLIVQKSSEKNLTLSSGILEREDNRY